MTTAKKVTIIGRTTGQKDFIEAIENNTMTFGIGPAGTGKTLLSVASAVKAYRAKEVERIIITRPVVEAGEKLGFLPGDLQDKMDPYMRPLYDSFRAYMSPEEMYGLMDIGVIEIAPLAFMRGRTLNKSFIIFDEAQNSTPAQMVMMLTRLGSGSKMVINGDLSQMDIPGGPTKSGLYVARKVIGSDVAQVSFIHLSQGDVVRHPVVKRIVEKYDEYTAQQEELQLEQLQPFIPVGNGNGQH